MVSEEDKAVARLIEAVHGWAHADRGSIAERQAARVHLHAVWEDVRATFGITSGVDGRPFCNRCAGRGWLNEKFYNGFCPECDYGRTLSRL